MRYINLLTYLITEQVRRACIVENVIKNKQQCMKCEDNMTQ